MKIVKLGHEYQLESFDGGLPQTLLFIEKEAIKDSTEMNTIRDGTTNEEILKVLIDRLYFLEARMSCRENAIVITKLEESLMWLEKRTEGRVARGVEGKEIA